ncbi:MAG: tRNA (N6-isopentenyl adenosine(37)-C2)-methylthiotransferase MiaB [Bacteroidetes bacterium]|nr:tRNA (N6-isopentenyl adenosine(37)-C2)-methylthiotransferase MiaB [Bacteroidota bacterium]
MEMYDSNPTLEGLKTNKLLSEERQGEVYANSEINPNGKKFYIESYGCQMNFSDSEIVASILHESGYGVTGNFLEADLILINTCAVRDNAEQRVRNRLKELKQVKRNNPSALIGMLGCMAERLKENLLEEEKLVDIVCGPDAYRDLPKLLVSANEGQKAVNVLLSREETYSDISPLRLDSNGISAFISIMRGCDNMCSFCVVPFTRGRERSRAVFTIVAEARDLFERGYREVTLLGQNVDSYKWKNPETENIVSFAELLVEVAKVDPLLRVRFSTSHPKDMTNDVLYAMATHDNICNYIHLPVQSGSSEVLERMNRTYNREWYKQRIESIRNIVPDCGISTDVISGFCGETEEDHQETLSLMDWVKYDMSYMFYYSERPGTLAARKYVDDIPEDVKKRRLSEIIALQNLHSMERNNADIGKVFKVLVEKPSRRSDADNCGRSDQNKMIVFPKENSLPGDYVFVKVTTATSATLIGKIVEGI